MTDEETIYIVDDDPVWLQKLTELVDAVFPRVQSFSSATEFLATYHESRPGCLVLDVVMPEMSGLDLYRNLTHNKSAIPVIFVTSHGTVATAVEAMQLGAIDFLEKPIQAQALWSAIRHGLVVDAQQRQRISRRRVAAERLARLSPGEREVLHLILEGKLNREIARELGLSTRTIEDRRARLMKKMSVKSLAEVVQLVMTH